MTGKRILQLTGLFLSSLILLGGCATDPGRTETETEIGIEFHTAQPLRDPGKIYLMDDVLYVNQIEAGVHIFDISNLSQPVNTGFLSIPGNADIAIKGPVLYADSHGDLVVIDISDPMLPREIERLDGVFPVQEVQEEMALGLRIVLMIILAPFWILAGGAGGDEEPGMQSPTGVGGSLARFAVVDNFLYVLGGSELKLFDVSEPADPVPWGTVEIGWDIETIYPFEDKLFIGSRDGMYIFDNSNPGDPTLISEFIHVTSCDPVVAEGNYAYVTLRSGSECWGDVDLLQVIDISDVQNPFQIGEYDMSGPYGLGIQDGLLAVCDGDAGLKLFDASNPWELELIEVVDISFPYDVIFSGNTSLVVALSGMHFFECHDPDQFRLISSIPVR